MLERIRYRFDNLIGRGMLPMVVLLSAVACSVAVAGAAAILLLGPPGTAPGAALWSGVKRIMTPNLVTRDTGSAAYLAAMFLLAIAGLVIFGTLIGLIKAGLDSKLADLRRGRSRVVERGHTVILGWSEEVFLMLEELRDAIPGRGGRRACTVVLSDQDKVAMENAIKDRLPAARRTRVVYRCGDPSDPRDVARVNLAEAAAVIVMPGEGPEADVRSIKTLLVLSHLRLRIPVVATVRDAQSLPVARLAADDLSEAGRLCLIDADGVLARLTAWTSLHAGLADVYRELLDFAGDELYLREAGALTGATFDDARLAYDNCSVLGCRRASGEVLINPPGRTALEPGDRLIVLAAAARTPLIPVPAPYRAGAPAGAPAPRLAMEVLIVGWNRRGATVLSILDRALPPGSRITISCSHEAEIPATSVPVVRVAEAGPYDLAALTDLARAHSVIVLADRHRTPAEADARALIHLVALGEHRPPAELGRNLAVEVHDERNRRLAELVSAGDFIVGPKLVSQLMTQLAKTPELSEILRELLGERGQTIVTRPASLYVRPGGCADFGTLVAIGAQSGETVLGYRTCQGSHRRVVLNPVKTHRRVWQPGDELVVIGLIRGFREA